jgi:hypothetical protein
MNDRSPEIIKFVRTILDQSNFVLTKLKQVPPGAFVKPDIASELLLILHTSDGLVDFFISPADPIEYHGVPRSLTQMEDEPELILRSEDGRNFWPWYAEKSASLKRCAKWLVTDWHRDLGEIRLHPAGPATPEEAFIDDLIRHVDGVRAYAQVIFDMTSEHRVLIQEIKFGPEDSN